MFKKITIVGLGLMGGSLAAACRKKFPGARITGITRNRKALALVLKKKWIHEGTDDISKGAAGADLVVICTPVDTYLPILKKIDRVVKDRALVMDVGSVKASVAKEVNERKWKRLSFVGCHPMVGSHKRGADAACPFLFDRGLILLAKDAGTCSKSLEQARQFWGRFSKRIVILKPEVHDRLVGEISHLPHALAVCLVQMTSRGALPFAAKGFRDTTRIAASASSIWLPIFNANKKSVLAGLARFEKELKYFRKLLRGPDPVRFQRYLDSAQKKRQAL